VEPEPWCRGAVSRLFRPGWGVALCCACHKKEQACFAGYAADAGLRMAQNMMMFPRVHAVLLGCLMAAPGSVSAASGSAVLQWRRLASLPVSAGLGAPYAGVSEGRLLVAGGANFPQAAPWAGGKKVWYDTVYALAQGDGSWESVGKLPRPMGYGVSVSTPAGLVCLGGSDAQRHYREVLRLELNPGGLRVEPLPPLPRPMANGCGAVLDNTVYMAGGIESPEATRALHTFWALDLSAAQPAWRELEPWPGPARMLAVAAVQDGAFFLLSGTELSADADNKPVRHYLKDVYRYRPGAGWMRMAEMPRAAVAAASPAPQWGPSQFLVLSGDDGTKLVFQPPQEHPGFARDILAYDTRSNSWTVAGQVPATQVTVPAVVWQGRCVLPSGEVRPGVRTPQVWALSFSAPIALNQTSNAHF
jgi:N-acetylneuraminate epimerase